MSTVKIAISIEKQLVKRVDQMVQNRVFPNRSKAFQIALEEKIIRIDKSRLAVECNKLDMNKEQKLANEGIKGDFEEWPEY